MKNNFELAYDYINKNYSEDEILEILCKADDTQKAAAILEIKSLKNNNLANQLIFHLTNQTGQIRELCAYKINEFIKEYPSSFQSVDVINTIIASLNDVNPNVVRFMLGTLKYIKNSNFIFKKLTNNIKKLNEEIKNKNRRGKIEEHIFTKKCFKIYWSLESIKKLIEINPKITDNNEDFANLLEALCDIDEYTIREKVAQIVNKLPKFKNSDIKKKLEADDNYFVKRHINEVL